MSLRTQWSLQDNYCSVPISLGFEYQCFSNTEVQALQMLQYDKKDHEKQGECWRGLMGLESVIKVVFDESSG